MSQSEFEIIRHHFAESGLYFDRAGVVLGIGDDAAALQIPEDSVLTMSMDVLNAGVHFPEDGDPVGIGYRALAVNLSDLAAMGAQPYCFTLGLSLPTVDEAWLSAFSSGLLELAQRFNCPLVGGDTTKGPLSIAIQVQGLNEKGDLLRRDGAKPGDKIYVTGSIGDGAIALASLGHQTHLGESFNLLSERLLKEQSVSCQSYFKNVYYRPEPRVGLARASLSLLNSGIDISDGLAGDLGHIARASAVGARLDSACFPWSSSASCCASIKNRLLAALYGGDDYELCVTVAADKCAEFEDLAASLGTRVSCIGEIEEQPGIRCVDESGELIELKGQAYQHFQSE